MGPAPQLDFDFSHWCRDIFAFPRGALICDNTALISWLECQIFFNYLRITTKDNYIIIYLHMSKIVCSTLGFVKNKKHK